jgi:hypothetical protein
MTFQPHKRSDTQPDVIQNGAQSATLCAFNQTLLFQTAMIHFNAPRAIWQTLGVPVRSSLRRLVAQYSAAPSVANPKHFDLTETFEPNNRAAAGHSPASETACSAPPH